VNEFHGDTLPVMQLEEQVPVFKGLRVPVTSTKLEWPQPPSSARAPSWSGIPVGSGGATAQPTVMLSRGLRGTETVNHQAPVRHLVQEDKATQSALDGISGGAHVLDRLSALLAPAESGSKGLGRS
jgi:hypothetical protein